MYTLYIGNKNYSSWSLRPWILLTQLGIPFAEQLVPFDDGGSWQKYRAFSPTGLVPCLHDEDTVVWESLGITEYLAEAHPEVWPADRGARAWAREVMDSPLMIKRGDLKDLVDWSKYVLFLSPRRPKFGRFSWKEKLEYYLEDDAERERIARNGYETVMKHHTSETRARQLVGFLRKLEG